MQSDNQLVVYNSQWNGVWSSGTWTGSIGNAYFMIMRNDGNLVMYKSDGTTIAWQTNTFMSNKPKPSPF
jgi:hypothetical protein